MSLLFLEEAVTSTELPPFEAHDPLDILTQGWLGQFNIWTILIRVALALLIGAIFGIERSRKRHTAGLRTFILVSLFSAMAALLDVFFYGTLGEIFPAVTVAVVLGGAIISGNTLLYSSKNQIKGLTTAAALWAQAFIGFSIGFGLYTITLISGLMLLIILSVLPKIEIYLKNRSSHFDIHLELLNKTDLSNFVKVIRDLGLIIDDIESNPAYINSGLSVYTISLSIYKKELKDYKTHEDIIEALKSLPYINHIEELNM